MRTVQNAIAATELFLVLPAALFFSALFVRNLTPVQLEPAHTAQRIVMWYSHLPVQVGLWALLMGLPLAVLVIGCATLLAAWTTDESLREATRQTLTSARAHVATLLIAGATVTAAAMLVFVAIHAMTD